MDVCCERCVMSGRDLCVGLITRQDGFYRVACLNGRDREGSKMRRPWPTGGLLRHGGGSRIRKNIINTYRPVHLQCTKCDQ